MIKLNTSIKPLTVAITSAIMFATLQSYAAPGDGTGDGSGGDGDTAVENPWVEPNNRVKLGYPLGTMAEWLAEADTYSLNPVNIRGGRHPDRDDPNDGPYDVIYIFPDAATANAWWDGNGTPPNEIPDTAVAFIHWELDNGSGTFPGIMSHADIDGFKSKNCIMAAGATIPQPGVKDGIPKDCSNPQGSSKRFKMNVLIPDAPIDLVYNVEPADLTYTNYETLPTHSGVEESGRIYRILQKWHNATAMDSATQTRDGVRMAGFRMELGTGVGTGFTEVAQAGTDGLAPDKTLGFELRPCMADHFFDVKRDRPGTGTNPCSESYDGAGDPLVDQSLPQEIWLEEEYSTFSPKMYSFNTDKRTTPIGGWWDKRPAGIYPPEIQTMGLLDSGYAASDSTAYFDADRVDGALPLSGYYGATTPNYFDIVATQITNGAPTEVPNINPPSPFGYLMHFGVLADDDYGIISQGVYVDEDGDPATEGDLIAWWDGDEYRWGSDPDVNGEIDGEAFAVVPTDYLVEWALHPLQEEPDPDTGEFPAGPLYEVGIMDDLAGLNVDSFVYLGRTFTGNQFTVRLTAVPVTSSSPYGPGTGGAPGFPMAGGEYGNEIPAWVGSPAASPEDYVSDDGYIDIKATGFAGDPLLISLADTGVVGALPTTEVENLRTGEIENITLLQDTTLLWKYTFDLTTAASGEVGGNNDGVLNVWPNDTVRVTYVDAFDGTNSDVVKTDEVIIPIETLEPVPPATDDDSGCSCSTSPDGSVDPILPAAVLFALGYLGLRRRENSSK